MTETLAPAVEDFSPGGKYNASGYFTPMRACERFYLFRNIPPMYSLSNDMFDLDSWMASDDS